MDFAVLLPALAIFTLVAGISLALLSKKRTDRLRRRGKPRTPSALARETPDPHFHPDKDITDPQHVLDKEPSDSARRG